MSNISCKFCGNTMKLAWPATKGKGSLMSCDKGAGGCGATCQANGQKNWDWREGKKDGR